MVSSWKQRIESEHLCKITKMHTRIVSFSSRIHYNLCLGCANPQSRRRFQTTKREKSEKELPTWSVCYVNYIIWDSAAPLKITTLNFVCVVDVAGNACRLCSCSQCTVQYVYSVLCVVCLYVSVLNSYRTAYLHHALAYFSTLYLLLMIVVGFRLYIVRF